MNEQQARARILSIERDQMILIGEIEGFPFGWHSFAYQKTVRDKYRALRTERDNLIAFLRA